MPHADDFALIAVGVIHSSGGGPGNRVPLTMQSAQEIEGEMAIRETVECCVLLSIAEQPIPAYIPVSMAST